MILLSPGPVRVHFLERSKGIVQEEADSKGRCRKIVWAFKVDGT